MVFSNGIVGTFVFRNEGDGCLTSKYMNEEEKVPYTEACVLQNRNRNNTGFVGEYRTVWIERNNAAINANLSIRPSRDNNANTFELKWTGENGDVIFIGIGMLFGDLLVGAYWDEKAE